VSDRERESKGRGGALILESEMGDRVSASNINHSTAKRWASTTLVNTSIDGVYTQAMAKI